MVVFNSHIAAAEDPISLKYLLAWKENRSDMCTDPLTVGKTLVTKHISAVLSSMVKSFFLESFIKLFLVFNSIGLSLC